MKNITLIVGIILLIANLLFGSILSIYPAFNMWLNCGVIVAGTVLLYTVGQIALKDGFKISLSFLFGTLGFICFILGLFTPQQYTDNWYLIAIILIVAFEAIILTVAHIISKTIK
jgi:hypothetical protein